ncbi:MAG: DUF4173 domain-containing protein [Flavobacteriales bacterium]|nr:DUF4173 domain-containing protein [Flavobacteriales bacterium]
MNKKSVAILCLTILYSILFYHQHVGINFIIFTAGALALFYYQDKTAFKSKPVLLMSLAALLSATFAFVHNSNLSMWTTIITLFLLPGVFINKRSSIWIDFGSSIYSSIVSPAYMVIDAVESSKNKEGKGNTFLRMLKFLVPVFFVVIFFFIFRSMNPLFENYTEEIADFISIGWFFFTLGGTLLVYAFYKQQRSKKLDDWEKGWKLSLNEEEVAPPKWSEGVAFILLFVVLNAMLILVNVMDVNYLYLGAGMPDGITHKQFVHKGVGMLILSILLGISILLYFFRGYLNFGKNKQGLKWLAILWVVQNVFMVISTSIRNTMYVDTALLTYKRIGVYFWLFFALLGLITLFVKLYRNKSVWYLARYNFMMLYVVLLISSVFDWDRILSDFNIGRAKQMTEISSLDKNYLLSISEGNIRDLFELKTREGFEVDSLYSYRGYGAYQHTNSSELDLKVYRFLADEEYGDWRSFSLRRNRVKEDIRQLNQEGKIKEMDLSYAYIHELKPLTKLDKLERLNIFGCQIVDWEHVAALKELKELKISYLSKDDVVHFKELKKLERVTVTFSNWDVVNRLEKILPGVQVSLEQP